MFKTVETTLASAVATSGTFTVAYPDGTNAGTFRGGSKNVMTAMNAVFQQPDGFTLSFGTSNITVTYLGATTIPAGTLVRLQLDEAGSAAAEDLHGVVGDTTTLVDIADGVTKAEILYIELGAPDVADPDGVCEAQSGAAGALTLDGALVSGGVATFDVPRNIVIDSGGADTAVLTITGTDVYGNTLVENITLNGSTAVAGKKAFKTVTSVVSSATISNGAFVGTGDVLGLPVHVSDTGLLLAELENGAAASAGTLVAGLDPNTASGATTADVRGTYDPNSAADGSKAFTLVMAVADATFLGNAQYAG